MILSNPLTGWHRRSAVPMALLAVLMLAAGPVLADPPPWAPAHGYRAQGKDKDDGPGRGHDRDFYRLPAGIDLGRCDRALLDRQDVERLADDVAGRGDGSGLARIGGVLIEILLDDAVGRSMDLADRACVVQALERAEDGVPVSWRDANGGVRYRLTPTRTFRNGDRYCREFSTRADDGAEQRVSGGIACRSDDGTWRILS